MKGRPMTDRKPRIGILGIMQDLYDDMIPGIAQRQAGYAAELAAALADVGEFVPSEPIKYRDDAQPEPNVTPQWDMADMTYNQGVHGAQDTANAMVRAGRRFAVLTDDWRSAGFRADVGRWARAAAAVTAWKKLKVAIFGYAMNDMGDIRVDESALVRSLGPALLAVAPGDLVRGMAAVTDE